MNLSQITTERSEATWQRHLLTLALAAHRVLSGAQVSGPLLVETNPPLIIWFSIVPVALAHVLGLDPYVALKLVVFLLIGASTLWSERILRAVNVTRSPALLYICVASVLSAEICLSCFQFGQREHMVVILILPYVFYSMCGADSRLHIGGALRVRFRRWSRPMLQAPAAAHSGRLGDFPRGTGLLSPAAHRSRFSVRDSNNIRLHRLSAPLRSSLSQQNRTPLARNLLGLWTGQRLDSHQISTLF